MASQRILVVGGVAAGPAAATEAKRVDPQAEVILFEQGGEVSYGACEMPYLLSGTVARARDLVVHSAEELHQTRGILARTQTRVDSIDVGRRHIRVTDLVSGQSEAERFDKLILATGAAVSWPDIEGLPGERVFAFRTLDDAARVTAAVPRRPERWLILGAGFVGVEVADQLREANQNVTLIAPSGPLNRALDAPIQQPLEAALAARGIGFRKARAVGVRRGVAGAPIALKTSDGELVGADYLVVATGTYPSVSLARAAGIRLGPSGGVATTDGMRTSASVVWACGDCAEVNHLVTGQPTLAPLSPAAFRTGRVAGRNASRRGRTPRASFHGTVNTYGISAAGLEVASAGLTESAARQAGFDAVGATIRHRSRSRHAPGGADIHVHLIVDRRSRRLLGGQIAGTDGAALRINPLVPLLRSRGTVDELYDLDLMYTPPFAPSLDPLLVAARAAQKRIDE